MSASWKLLVVAALAVGAFPVEAIAERARGVRIESDPPGAAVYVNDRARPSRGTTPLDLELAPGRYTVILELDGHQAASHPLVVDAARGKKPADPVNLKVVLTPSLSTLDVVGNAPAGAHVLIDDRDRGEFPLKVELEPGRHQIQVMVGGAVVFEQDVRLDSGEARRVEVASPAPAATPPAAAPRDSGLPTMTARLGTRAIWRRFVYEGATDASTTESFDSDAKLMVRVETELAPWRRSPAARRLWPLTLTVAAGITTTDTATRYDESANYNQRELEAGLRYRIGLGARAALGLDVGWAALLYNFNGDLAYALPDVDYQVMRLGVRGEGTIGRAVGWIGVENRLVAGAGDMGDRFKSASADGFAARIGALTRVWGDRLELGAEYSLVRFGWSFEPKDTGDAYIADGATDTFHNLGVWIGASY